MYRSLTTLTILGGLVLVPFQAVGQSAPVQTPVAIQPPAPEVPGDGTVTAPDPVVAQPPAPVVVAPHPAFVPSGPVPMIAIRDIDREMTALSGDVTASHARLQQITSMVLEHTGGGARLLIEHENDMGSTFRLVRASYSLDGATISTHTDENGSLADQTGFAVYNGTVSSGDHNLTVSLEYQGNGYGIFSYIRGYTFRARSVQSFNVPEGRALRLVVVGYERGGATSAIEERPAIRYVQNTMTLQEAQALTQRANAAPTPAAVPARGAAQGGDSAP